MNYVTPRRPSGFVEYLPEDQAKLQYLFDTIRSVYVRYGFLPVETPAIELAEVLLAKGGGDTEKEVYRFTKGDKEYALHYDLTVPLARYVAEHENELVFPFRRYQMQKVWRAERAQKGRFREFYQCDADIIGSTSMGHDAELVALIADVMQALNLGKFVVRINNRKLLAGFLESIGLQASLTKILRAVDKLEKIGSEEVVLLLKACGCADDDAQQILDFVSMTGSSAELIEKLHGLGVENHMFQTGLEELQSLLEQVSALGVDSQYYMIDLRIVRGLDYYTGTVYETVMLDYPEFGSVLSGGRYDNLAEYYTKSHLPGVGVSVGLTRLFAMVLEIGIVLPANAPVQVFIANDGEGARNWALKVANDFRDANIATQVCLEQDKFAKQFKYADKLGVPFTVVIGGQEVQDKQVTLKNMQSGKQETLAIDTAIERVLAG